jgi:hypothetical protein
MSAWLLAYATFRVLRSQLNPGLIRDTFPSLVCPFVLLSVLSVFRTVRGAVETASVRHDAICLAFALVMLEGVAPLAGKGTADYGDVGGSSDLSAQRDPRLPWKVQSGAAVWSWREVSGRERSLSGLSD